MRHHQPARGYNSVDFHFTPGQQMSRAAAVFDKSGNRISSPPRNIDCCPVFDPPVFPRFRDFFPFLFFSFFTRLRNKGEDGDRGDRFFIEIQKKKREKKRKRTKRNEDDKRGWRSRRYEALIRVFIDFSSRL